LKPVSYYSKIIPFSLKKGKVKEFIGWYLEKKKDQKRRNRLQEYSAKTIEWEEALKKIFPDKKFEESKIKELENYLEKFIEKKQQEKFPSELNPYLIISSLDKGASRLLFSLTLFTEPEVILETGVANGFSSSYILQALKILNKGKLISLEYLYFPWHTKKGVGLAIPNELKEKQEIVASTLSDELIDVIDKTRPIDIFLHDSAHTYNHMLKEFRIAWPNIKKGGLLMADDVGFQDAFLDFVDEIRNKNHYVVQKDRGGLFGIIIKE